MKSRAAVGRGDEVDERAAVRVGEGAADRHGGAAAWALGDGGGGGGPAETTGGGGGGEVHRE
jgi:hypothetical protein